MREVVLQNGVKARYFGSKQYVEAAVNSAVDYLAKRSQKLVVNAPTPLLSGYRPEGDVNG